MRDLAMARDNLDLLSALVSSRHDEGEILRGAAVGLGSVLRDLEVEFGETPPVKPQVGIK
jgi:hypothetical protein